MNVKDIYKQFGFSDKRRFLSNMWETRIEIPKEVTHFKFLKVDAHIYHSSEQIYYLLKSDIPRYRDNVKSIAQPYQLKKKKFLKEQPLRRNWEVNRVKAMCIALYYKYQNPSLKKKLINYNIPTIEYNYWNDRFWGSMGLEGEDTLGKLLTTLRGMLISNEGLSPELLYKKFNKRPVPGCRFIYPKGYLRKRDDFIMSLTFNTLRGINNELVFHYPKPNNKLFAKALIKLIPIYLKKTKTPMVRVNVGIITPLLSLEEIEQIFIKELKGCNVIVYLYNYVTI